MVIAECENGPSRLTKPSAAGGGYSEAELWQRSNRRADRHIKAVWAPQLVVGPYTTFVRWSGKTVRHYLGFFILLSSRSFFFDVICRKLSKKNAKKWVFFQKMSMPTIAFDVKIW